MAQDLLGGRVEPVDIQDEIQRSYLDYAMSVIVGRALPDVRDGLKPVHRRILWSMLDAETVDFVPNYDGYEQEPVVLPARFPNLLVNGAGGIAVGMATNIPPHNLGEVIDATIAQIDNPDITMAQLMKHVKGPDFPTGATIVGRQGIKDYQETGRGSIKMRGLATIEETR